MVGQLSVEAAHDEADDGLGEKADDLHKSLAIVCMQWHILDSLLTIVYLGPKKSTTNAPPTVPGM